MRPSSSDPALYSIILDARLTGIAAMQVVDILGAGSEAFNDYRSILEEKFESKPRTRPHLCFAGQAITPAQGGSYRS